jgi:GxxExxY protein
MELERLELDVKAQMPISVYYLSKPVGEFFCDLCVEDSVIIEVKTAESLSGAHEAQIFNYLKATPIEVGLLLNFGPRPEFVRKLLTNDMKPWFKDLPAERSDDPS